jgi:hypothetical protein
MMNFDIDISGWRPLVMKLRLAFLAGVIGVGLAALPAFAHHSFAAEYDAKKPVELKGKLIELEWVNPHAWIHMEVVDPSGKTVKWSAEMGSPNILMRNGWRRDSIKPGDQIIVTGSAAKDGSNMANARTVTMGDGKRVFNAGSSGDAGTNGAGAAKQ